MAAGVEAADAAAMPYLAAPSAGAHSPVSTGSTSSTSTTKKNGRKGSRKVRTGCITCKIRRVKCDEIKPACERCTKTGRKCDGYAAPRNGSLPSHPSPPNPAGITRAMSPFAAWDASEQRAFEYYRTCSATALFAPATSSFWARIVPALCFEEPAVRHAVLVISSLHQNTYGGGPLGTQLKGCDAVCTPFAAGQYGKALRSLQQWRPPSAAGIRSTASVTVPLLACLLFICIEFMLGDPSAAQVHIIQGRAILARLAEDPREARGPGADLIRRELVPVYTRLSVASFVFGSKPAPIPAALKPARGAEVVFERLEDAELSLHEIMDDGLRFTKDAKMWTFSAVREGPNWADEFVMWQAQKAELMARASEWHVAFSVLLAAQGAGGMSDAARMCRLYYLTTTVYMGTALEQTECVFDEYMTTFASMVAVAGEILQAEEERGGTPTAGEGARFSFESGIVPPLYFAAIKCRHPGLRRAALNLLRRKGLVDCKENLWDTRLVSRIATRIMEIEEARAVRTWGEGVVEPHDGDADGYVPGRSEIKHFLKHIPVSQPPCIPHHEADWIFETEAASPVPVGDLLDAPEVLQEFDGRASPFHVPEAARVINADISPRVGGGSWVTFWVMPETEGERHWDVIREFIGRGLKSALSGVA
ncbi:hypothetical protein ACHAQA_005712 [Verticillium albo-atrum]